MIMTSGRRYRVAAVGGTVLLTVLAVVVANHPTLQAALSDVTTLPANTYANGALVTVVATTLLVVVWALWPLFKPRPRRILDTISETEKRLFLAATALATIGYFDWSYRLHRTTLIATIAVLALALPTLFVLIRRRPTTASRALLVGDDPDVMATVADSADLSLVGYVAPSTAQSVAATPTGVRPGLSDGGRSDGGIPRGPLGAMERLGGLSRLEEVLVERDIDTVLLAFSQSDRDEFFGALATCYSNGVRTLVHRDHADSVLISDIAGGDLVDVDLEPWDWQDHVTKRLFDVVFAASALAVLSPVMLAIAVAVKLDSPGPVLYSHERTAEFGETFRVYKFRSMVSDAEARSGATISDEDAGGIDPRVTRVGRVLRKTHLDEIPQLWSILKGDMSVVGPRPERPELDTNIQAAIDEWQRRWFVRPGLTGLAQIRGVTGHQPEEKIRYDIEYIRRQSFWFDLKIVIRQLHIVYTDVVELLRGVEERE
jgi:exopolysaccharide biosynthesis polyprenyl glycosylphosphotransferase